MKLYIQDYETEKVLRCTTDVITIPSKGDRIIVDDDWYEVVDRAFSFKRSIYNEENVCSIFVKLINGL